MSGQKYAAASVRLRNILDGLDIRTLEDLGRCGTIVLRREKNCGPATIAEAKRLLEEYGIMDSCEAGNSGRGIPVYSNPDQDDAKREAR